MKAVLDGMIASKENTGQSEHLSKNDEARGRDTANTIFARLRRLEQRCDNLESKASALRRDVDRVEKRQSRDKELPSTKGENPIPGLNPALFGLEV